MSSILELVQILENNEEGFREIWVNDLVKIEQIENYCDHLLQSKVAENEFGAFVLRKIKHQIKNYQKNASSGTINGERSEVFLNSLRYRLLKIYDFLSKRSVQFLHPFIQQLVWQQGKLRS